ncbi:HalOD1 output domain-containing protein [Halegenticoccus soli]|uniref:HalOD1 output domain-containing protein n=1 Tax=Halegenticoccus soli TaxID=1985678 RepID=UPI00130401FA
MTNDETPILLRYELSPHEAPSEGVYFALATLLHRSPLDLDPLDDAVDPDALDALFRRRRGGELRSVEFEYLGYKICVCATEIQIHRSSP